MNEEGVEENVSYNSAKVNETRGCTQGKESEQDEENKKDGIQIRPEAVWSFPINTLLLCFGQGGKRGKLEEKR